MMDDMYTFGVPHTVVTDQGPEFVSQMQNILFDSLNIDRKVTTGYHPRCNGTVEQFNKNHGQQHKGTNATTRQVNTGLGAMPSATHVQLQHVNQYFDKNNAVPRNIQLQPKSTIVKWSRTQV
jgi:hypothetical protein